MVHDVARAAAILEALGQSTQWDFQPVAGSVEMKALAVDSSLARKTLQWRDLLAGEKIVQWTADWYRQVINGAAARAVTLAQIETYMKLAATGAGTRL